VTIRRAENLFRKNALRALAAKWEGRPIALVPRPWLWLALLSLVLASSAVGFACRVEYARKESARGWLVSQQGVARISHGGFASVAEVLAEPGDMLKRGDIIAYVSAEQLLGDGSASMQAISRVLRAELAELESREALLSRQRAARRDSNKAQIRGIDAELRALNAQSAEQFARVERNEQELVQLRSAHEQGAVAQLAVLQQQNEIAALRQAQARLQQETDRLLRERRRLSSELQQVALEADLRLSELVSLRAELQRRITRNESARLQAIESPIDGTVVALDLVPGSSIQPRQLLAAIVPHRATLVADVYVSSRAIGLIEPGQRVRLRFDAFPHEQFGVTGGRVVSIADHVLLPGDMPNAFPLQEASYKVGVHLDADHVTAGPDRYALKPGMLLTAEIVLESRSIANWLVARLDVRL
jgi:membrane fusion protein